MTTSLEPPEARTRKILLVDDEPHILELYRLWFGGLGWSLEVAHTGPEALAQAVAWGPDAIVLDVMLPGYSGLEVLHRLRGLGSRAAVIVCSALDDPEDRARALRQGAVDYVLKPFSVSDLEQRLRRLLAQRAAGSPRVTA